MINILLFNIFFFIFFVDNSSAGSCNGFKMKVKDIKNCNSDQVMYINENFTASFGKDCNIITSGCLKFKDFKTAVIDYRVTKNNIAVANGKFNLCENAPKANDDIKAILALLDLPNKCPVVGNTVCANSQKVDFNKYKQYLKLMRGNIIANVKVAHDTGTSCYVIKVDVIKA